MENPMIEKINNKIRDLAAAGVSVEDVMNELLEALENSEKTKAYWAKQKVGEARALKLDEIEDVLIKDFEKECFDWVDVGCMAALVASKEHPEWTAEQIGEMEEGAIGTAKNVSKIIGRDPMEAIKCLFNDVINKNLGEGSAVREGLTSFNPPRGLRAQLPLVREEKSDEDRIKTFLDSLKP